MMTRAWLVYLLRVLLCGGHSRIHPFDRRAVSSFFVAWLYVCDCGRVLCFVHGIEHPAEPNTFRA